MSTRTPLTFLGTGNFSAPGRYWNSFLIGDRILVEASPSVLPNLRLARIDPRTIDVIFLSHFHADHTFGWPFLLLSYLTSDRRSSELSVVGPPGVQPFLENMLRAGAIDHLVKSARATLGGFPLNVVEVTGEEQDVSLLREQFPQLPFALTHRGGDVGSVDLPRVIVPGDLETVDI